MELIQMKEIKKTYHEGKSNEVHALRGIDLNIKKGNMVAIMGVSGSGKSTLLHILGCLDSCTSGTYYLNDIEITKCSEQKLAQIRNKKIGFVLQEYGLIMNQTVEQNVSVPLLFNPNVKTKEIKKMVQEALERVQLGSLKNRKVTELSGGQRQRVAIARAIVNQPEVLLADEPTGALDIKTSNEIMDFLAELNQSGVTILVVTHDAKVAEKCDYILEIADGVLV